MTDVDAVATPQDLREALRALFEREHLSQNRVVTLVNDAGGELGKTTLSNILSGKTHLPRWDTVEQILTACQVTGRELVAWEHAYQRASRGAAGQPLTAHLDPIELGVHKAITTGAPGQDATLTAYVPRPHDTALAEIVTAAAEEHQSRFVVLLGDSSTGKTRALWEALAPLRDHGGWRVWHPTSPDRRTALREGLGRVRSRTVVWLNESQEYLGGDGRPGDEKAAVALRDLLRDPTRAPVLVVGTLWRAYYTELRRPHASQVRELLDNTVTTVLEVPSSFADADPDALAAAAATDPRFRYARDRAEDGRITQYLAGGPELLHRYDNELSVGAKAIVRIAMDARRMGHRNAIPHGLLAEAADAYVSPSEWNTVASEPDWLEQALAEAARPCKGADGPLPRIAAASARSRSTRTRSRIDPAGRPGGAGGGPVYLLADFLDQHARTEYSEIIPPIPFWEALTTHAHPGDYTVLGRAASDRGLYRDAAQLWVKATRVGDIDAAAALVGLLRFAHPDDKRPADWVIDHIHPSNPYAVAWLLEQLREAGWTEQAHTLAERAASAVTLDAPSDVAWLLEQLREAGWTEQAHTLAERAVPAVGLDDPYAVAGLLEQLRKGGWTAQAHTLIERAVPAVGLDDPYAVAGLLEQLRKGGWTAQAHTLAERAVSAVGLDDPRGVVRLLERLSEAGLTEQAHTLIERAVSAVTLDDLYGVARLLWRLRGENGWTGQAHTLAERAVSAVGPDDLRGVARLLERLWEAALTKHAQTLIERAASAVTLDNPHAVAGLLEQLRKGGWTEMAHTLAERAVPAVALDGLNFARDLLEQLRAARWNGAARELTVRLPAAGNFDLFLDNVENPEDYRYGREPDDGAVAPEWTWDDLF
ncbi:helix-turn-helix domain-containing protein [Nocardia sp. CA-135953]|uniref:helix-turn-helix domain-containing protein n=1 Tax=Nocardia sp. CA-135953 TaxID=3239978 RepID=UPI003D95C9AA